MELFLGKTTDTLKDLPKSIFYILWGRSSSVRAPPYFQPTFDSVGENLEMQSFKKAVGFVYLV